MAGSFGIHIVLHARLRGRRKRIGRVNFVHHRRPGHRAVEEVPLVGEQTVVDLLAVAVGRDGDARAMAVKLGRERPLLAHAGHPLRARRDRQHVPHAQQHVTGPEEPFPVLGQDVVADGRCHSHDEEPIVQVRHHVEARQERDLVVRRRGAVHHKTFPLVTLEVFERLGEADDVVAGRLGGGRPVLDAPLAVADGAVCTDQNPHRPDGTGDLGVVLGPLAGQIVFVAPAQVGRRDLHALGRVVAPHAALERRLRQPAVKVVQENVQIARRLPVAVFHGDPVHARIIGLGEVPLARVREIEEVEGRDACHGDAPLAEVAPDEDVGGRRALRRNPRRSRIVDRPPQPHALGRRHGLDERGPCLVRGEQRDGRVIVVPTGAVGRVVDALDAGGHGARREPRCPRVIDGDHPNQARGLVGVVGIAHNGAHRPEPIRLEKVLQRLGRPHAELLERRHDEQPAAGPHVLLENANVPAHREQVEAAAPRRRIEIPAAKVGRGVQIDNNIELLEVT